MKKLISVLLSVILLIISVVSLADESTVSDKETIEYALNLANNPNQEWTYSASSDSWTLSIVTAVTKPVIEDEEGVSVCVPGAYVTGIDMCTQGRFSRPFLRRCVRRDNI